MLWPACMAELRTFNLDAIRTDGWFERVGEKVGSFEALCSILGERFFAFSLITGARVTTLTVDRSDPSASVVEFEVSGATQEEGTVTQTLSLDRFRRRLVGALLAEEPSLPAPTRETDVEGIQRHIGVRCLLLAPLFGFSLLELRCDAETSTLSVLQDGEHVSLELSSLRALLRRAVVDELERVSVRAAGDSGLDLTLVAKAQKAAADNDPDQVVELLGSWLMPLSFFLRTPEGRALGAEVRQTLGEALGLLGSALVALDDLVTAEQALRLGVQYSAGTAGAADVYARFGSALMASERSAEAIALLRRAAALGAPAVRVWPPLALAFFRERRYLAAWSAISRARSQGVVDASLGNLAREIAGRVPALAAWQRWCGHDPF
jgi:hypothetical protein